MEKKLTVVQMAAHLGVSKEAIYNRIRRGTLESVTENGKKYVLLTSELEQKRKKPVQTQATNSDYVELLKQQLHELKEKNEKLETDKEKLLQEKEDLLVSTQEKIESIYKSRDEYIQSIISLMNTPSIEHQEPKQEHIVELEEFEEEEEIDIVDQICECYEEWVSLKDYLSSKNYSKKEKKEIVRKIYPFIERSRDMKIEEDVVYVKKSFKLKKIFKKLNIL